MSWCEPLGEKKACDWGWGLWLGPAVVWVMFRGQGEIKAWLTVRTGLVLGGSRVGPLLKHPDLWLPGLLGQELSIVPGCDHFHNTVCVLLCPCEGERSSPSSYRVCVILRRSGWLCEREREGKRLVCVCVCVCVCVLETETWCLEIAARRLALLFAFPSLIWHPNCHMEEQNTLRFPKLKSMLNQAGYV